jgi:hypothetical protein
MYTGCAVSSPRSDSGTSISGRPGASSGLSLANTGTVTVPEPPDSDSPWLRRRRRKPPHTPRPGPSWAALCTAPAEASVRRRGWCAACTAPSLRLPKGPQCVSRCQCAAHWQARPIMRPVGTEAPPLACQPECASAAPLRPLSLGQPPRSCASRSRCRSAPARH